jgi:hypothetical protein
MRRLASVLFGAAVVLGSLASAAPAIAQTPNAQDIFPAPRNVTAQDTLSSSATNGNGQVWITGVPSGGSVAAFTAPSVQNAIIQISGNWTGTLQVEVSADGGTTWTPHAIHQVGSPTFTSTFTSNVIGSLNLTSKTNVRVRATAAMTGTATVSLVESYNLATVYVGNESGTSGNPTSVNVSQVGGASISGGVPIQGATYTSTEVGVTLGTAGTFSSALASNTSRHSCYVQNTSTDTEYYFFGATGSATTANSFQVPSGQSFNCAGPDGTVATDNVAMAGKATSSDTVVVQSK